MSTMTKTKRVHILSSVNAANVSKVGNTYTVRDVVHAVDGIVLNRRLYPGDELKKAVGALNGKPAPAGHPKDSKGRHISASNGEALAAAWIGAYCQNSRYEGGRAMVDIVINAGQANAMPDGRRVVERLDAAIAGTDTSPVGVSSGLFLEAINAQGTSRGKDYDTIATNMAFDHIAILLDEQPAGTPEEGVGMFLNADGQEEQVEQVVINTEPADRRELPRAGASFAEQKLAKAQEWLKNLVGNGIDVSFDQITSGLYALLPEGAWLRDVYAREAIWTDREGKLFQQDYSVSSDGSVAWSGNAVEVSREVTYKPINNREDDQVFKETIIAALNAAGISGVAAMTDAQLLASYEAVKAKLHQDALTAANEKLTVANSKIAEHEATAQAAQNAERDALATKLAINSSLTVDDLKALGLPRLKELDAKAAPVVVGNSGGTKKSEFEGYSLNAHLEGSK